MLCLFRLIARLRVPGSFFLIVSLATAGSSAQSAASAGAQQAENPTALQALPKDGAINPGTASKERWDVLPIHSDDFKTARPLVGELDKFPEFTRELLSVQWRPDDPIDLYVIRPTGVAHPPVVLFLYSFPADTSRFLDNEFCKTLVKQGFAAVGFVSALTGARYHDRPLSEWFVSELPESLGTSVHDVQLVLNYLGTRGDLDMEKVGIFGQGSGGTIAILSAAVDPRLKAVDVLDPWGDWPDWLALSPQVPQGERADYLKPAFLAGVAPFDPVTWMARLEGRSFRLQEPGFATNVPQQVRDRLEKALPPSAQQVTYTSLSEYMEKAGRGGAMLSWLSRELQSAQRGSSSSGAFAVKSPPAR